MGTIIFWALLREAKVSPQCMQECVGGIASASRFVMAGRSRSSRNPRQYGPYGLYGIRVDPSASELSAHTRPLRGESSETDPYDERLCGRCLPNQFFLVLTRLQSHTTTTIRIRNTHRYQQLGTVLRLPSPLLFLHLLLSEKSVSE